MDTIYSVKRHILRLREEVESEFLSENMDEQKLLELSMELDSLILIYVKGKEDIISCGV